MVEDDYVLATDAAEALRGAGAEVLGPYPTEAAALDCLEEHHPSAAVVDINLGGVASFRVSRALRSWGIPFLFVSGYDAAAIPAEFADVPYFEKPVASNTLIGALIAVLGVDGLAERPEATSKG